MLSVTQARERMLSAVGMGTSEPVPIALCAGRVLTHPVTSARAQPPFRASAMDGYALRSIDTPGRLRVVGESAAGRSYSKTLGAGEAVRISTGAAAPEGADTIVIQEDARREGDWVEAPETASYRHLRPEGSDFAAGATLLPAGRTLDAGALTLAAAAGFAALDVAAQPRVTVFSGGDEIVLPGETPSPDQVFDSTRYGIATMIAAAGARPQLTPLLRDDRDAIRGAIAAAFDVSDLIVIIGGASVGDHDHARAALAELGTELYVNKVAVRPGKPTWFGMHGATPVLGLPGNPASALVCARLFLRPLLDKMLGRDAAEAVAVQRARVHTPLKANGPRETYWRARSWIDAEGQLWADAHGDQDSSLMRVFADSNCLIAQAPDAPASAKGNLVAILPL